VTEPSAHISQSRALFVQYRSHQLYPAISSKFTFIDDDVAENREPLASSAAVNALSARIHQGKGTTVVATLEPVPRPSPRRADAVSVGGAVSREVPGQAVHHPERHAARPDNLNEFAAYN
jgi:hypothetical protein